MARDYWTYRLEGVHGDVFLRLCECRTIKKDLPILVNTAWAWMKEKNSEATKEDALVDVLELLDANSQWELADLTIDEYNELKSE